MLDEHAQLLAPKHKKEELYHQTGVREENSGGLRNKIFYII
jgi:hypothetical protein